MDPVSFVPQQYTQPAPQPAVKRGYSKPGRKPRHYVDTSLSYVECPPAPTSHEMETGTFFGDVRNLMSLDYPLSPMSPTMPVSSSPYLFGIPNSPTRVQSEFLLDDPMDFSAPMGPTIIPPEAHVFWDQLTEVIMALASLPHNVDRKLKKNDLRAFLEQVNRRDEPTEFELDLWLDGTLQEGDLRITLGLYQLSFPVFPRHVLTDDFLDEHRLWSSMSPLHRYYCLAATINGISEEKSFDDPTLESWSFQFLMLCRLYGTPRLQTKAGQILQELPLQVWCSRYLYCGGLVRTAVTDALQQLTNTSDPHFEYDLYEVCRLIDATVVEKPYTGQKKPSDWVAFFEQYENLGSFMTSLYQYLESRQEKNSMYLLLQAFANTLNRLTPEDFVTYRMKEGIFEKVTNVVDDTVFVKYRGCPRPILVPRDRLRDPRIVTEISNFVPNVT